MRTELLEAGESVFAARGYAAATIDDVVRVSGTSRASFYRYFSGKDKLFEELSLDCFAEMRAVIGSFGAIGPAPVERAGVVELLERYRCLHERHSGVIRAWTELTSPPGTVRTGSGAAAVRSLASEMERALAGAFGPGEVSALRAFLLFLLIERSSYYVSSRLSNLDRSRLQPTLATLVHRGYLGGPR